MFNRSPTACPPISYPVALRAKNGSRKPNFITLKHLTKPNSQRIDSWRCPPASNNVNKQESPCLKKKRMIIIRGRLCSHSITQRPENILNLFEISKFNSGTKLRGNNRDRLSQPGEALRRPLSQRPLSLYLIEVSHSILPFREIMVVLSRRRMFLRIKIQPV